MKTPKMSSRTDKKIACKVKYHQLFVELENAIHRKAGGYETLSYSTSVSASTLRNGINANRETDTITLLTFLDFLKTIRKSDPYFTDYFSREFLYHEEVEDNEISIDDILNAIANATNLIKISVDALADGKLSKQELSEIKDALIANIAKENKLVEKLSLGGSDD